jgi:hypothetical protein
MREFFGLEIKNGGYLGFCVSGFIRQVFAQWVFIGCSRHFEHRVFTGVFMGVQILLRIA